MGMYEKAVEELGDPKNVIIDDRERLRMKIHYHNLLGNTDKCNILYKQALIAEQVSVLVIYFLFNFCDQFINLLIFNLHMYIMSNHYVYLTAGQTATISTEDILKRPSNF